jgi:hypothetical protein
LKKEKIMADKLITPEFRAAYAGLFRATAPKENPNGAKKYSIRAAFPPEADIKDLKAACAQVAADKWGKNVPKTMRSPFRFNEELDNPIPGIGGDWVVMTFSANEDRRPGVVDATVQDIIDESEVYSGAWFRAQVRPYAYDQAGNKGIAFGLENVQKTRDDDALGSGRIPASKVFESFGSPIAASSAGALFD